MRAAISEVWTPDRPARFARRRRRRVCSSPATAVIHLVQTGFNLTVSCRAAASGAAVNGVPGLAYTALSGSAARARARSAACWRQGVEMNARSRPARRLSATSLAAWRIRSRVASESFSRCGRGSLARAAAWAPARRRAAAADPRPGQRLVKMGSKHFGRQVLLWDKMSEKLCGY